MIILQTILISLLLLVQTMKYSLVTLLVTLVQAVCGVELKKEKSNLDDPVIFCDGCFALVSEVVKDMSDNTHKQTLQTRIEQSLNNVCSTDRLRAYMFSPPTQVKTCFSILNKYQHFLSNILKTEFSGGKTSSVERVTQIFCTEAREICQNFFNIFVSGNKSMSRPGDSNSKTETRERRSEDNL